MSQHDFDIANQLSANLRLDLNNALKALASLSSGATEPTDTFANMLWYDTTNNTLKMRAEANDAWISVGYLDQSADAFRIFDDTQVVNSSGTQTGIIGDQTTATWEAGTSTTESLVSPAKVKAAIEELAPTDAMFGVGQTWAIVSRTASTSYQNTTGKPIQVSVALVSYDTNSGEVITKATSSLQVSSNGSTWITVGSSSTLNTVQDDAQGEPNTICVVVPPNHYYRYLGEQTNFALLS